MIYSTHEEREYVGQYLIVKVVAINECPKCSIIVTAVVPVLFKKEAIQNE
jgi:hypothetical protein